MSANPTQLSLGIALRADSTFANFLDPEGGNRLSLSLLQKFLRDAVSPPLIIWGPSSSGLTHLLQASAHYVESLERSAQYLPLAELKIYPPAELFDGMEQFDLLCLDDLDLVLGDPLWESSIFHLF